mgnify:CR=1 FL=1
MKKNIEKILRKFDRQNNPHPLIYLLYYDSKNPCDIGRYKNEVGEGDWLFIQQS